MNKQELIDFELKVKDAWEAGLIKAPVHLCGGNEDQLIEIFKEIKPHDIVFSSHRSHYHALLHDVASGKLFSEILGEPSGTCGGRARSMGFIDHSRHFFSSAIVGGCCAIAVGVAMALKSQWDRDPLTPDEVSSRRHVWAFVGDGVLDGGHFWEAHNYAAGHDLPVTFVVEHNDRATCTKWLDRNGSWGLNFDWKSRKIRQYFYDATYPHVGSGAYIQF